MKTKKVYIFKYFIICIDIFLGFILCLNLLSLFSITPKNILSNSMYPTISVGDTVYVNKNIPYSNIQKGDIIAYQNGGIVIVHRVVDISNEGLITKGDNAEELDGNPINEGAYLGRVRHWMKSGSEFYELIGTWRFRIFSVFIIIITFFII